MDNIFLPVGSSTAANTFSNSPVGIGVIGLGAFGRFCLEAYLGMPDVRVVALADTDPRSLAVGARVAPRALACADTTELLTLPDVDVVTVCAPPDCHLSLVLAAILAGKHVVCDKPLGISLGEFDVAVAAAGGRGVALGINLVLRHHPLYHALNQLTSSYVLGAPRRLAVENYADEAIGFGLAHWLWNPARSGGLALSADVHWLDLATRLLGPAYQVQAWQPEASDGVGPRRLVTTTHGGGAVSSVYHAFDTRPAATGCTVLAAFDEGEVRIEGWIPTRLQVSCPADRVTAVAALLSSTAVPTVTLQADDRAALVLHGESDRRTAYLDMIRTTVRLVLAQARGEGDCNDLLTARTATATALAAEASLSAHGWVTIESMRVLEPTG